MYSLLSNYVYIHRELWHHSKKPFLFQALEIVSQVLTGFFGILLPSGILFFLEQSRGGCGFWGCTGGGFGRFCGGLGRPGFFA